MSCVAGAPVENRPIDGIIVVIVVVWPRRLADRVQRLWPFRLHSTKLAASSCMRQLGGWASRASHGTKVRAVITV